MKNLFETLRERGLVEQVTSEDLGQVLHHPIKVYAGFDPTADSLHLGSLIGIMMLAWFQRAGHTPVVVLGGATGRIGDPSGKSLERPLLTDATIQYNVIRLTQFFETLFSRLSGPRPLICNNNDWLGSYPLVDFLRDIGKQFRIGPMLAKESVRTRITSEEGMSFTEFSYQLLQGYDFAYLAKEKGVVLQMGGSDQWGNITAGIDLNRKLGGPHLLGLTWPLLTRSDGKKFGKSEEGAIWLEADRLSPYHFYQHLVRISDADVGKCLRCLTFLPMEEIRKIESSQEPNFAQKRLAEEVTRFIHGEEGLRTALLATEGLAPGKEATLTGESLRLLAQELSPVKLLRGETIGARLVDLLVRVELAPSKSEATRLIKSGGAYLNNQRVEDPTALLQEGDLIEGSYVLLSWGKKKRLLIQIM